MKESYRNLKKSDEYDNCKDYYHLMSFQHFFGDAICDEEFSSSLSDSVPACIQNAWAVDMYRSTYNLVQKLADQPNPQRDVSILSEYITQVESSKHAYNKEIYKIIIRDISNDILKNIWSNLSNRETKSATLVSNSSSTSLPKTIPPLSAPSPSASPTSTTTRS